MVIRIIYVLAPRIDRIGWYMDVGEKDERFSLTPYAVPSKTNNFLLLLLVGGRYKMDVTAIRKKKCQLITQAVQLSCVSG